MYSQSHINIISKESLIGLKGQVDSPLLMTGYILINNRKFDAHSIMGPISVGETVEVIGVYMNFLQVIKAA